LNKVEFFRNTNIDFLGWKWRFLAFSLVFSTAGILSMLFWHGLPMGVEFRGGTDVNIKFADAPKLDRIRASLDAAGLHSARLQPFGSAGDNEVLISLSERETSETDLSSGKNRIVNALVANAPADKVFLNDATGKADLGVVRDKLAVRDPLHAAPEEYERIARQILDYRDKTKSGVITNLDELKGTVPDPVIDALKQDFFTSNFGVRGDSIVGPQVGGQLKRQAWLAVGFSLAGMLVYLWFRFELIYGVAAVVAVFHDTLITVGAFSLTNKEITLTVIAAILTLVGYSMNDTIVVFDRIRENVKLMRRESLAEIVNRSINQTLSRTILTSGLTFLTVLSLFLFGGEVLHGFSFALVVGILIGTYSSIAVAAPMLVAYQDWRSRRGREDMVAASAGKGKVRAKV
jgi:preprotein translocase subunit SecF